MNKQTCKIGDQKQGRQQGCEDSSMRKEQFFQKVGASTTLHVHMKEWLDLYLAPYRNINSTWTEDLNVRPKLLSS